MRLRQLCLKNSHCVIKKRVYRLSLYNVKILAMAAQGCVSELTIVGIVCLLSLYGLCQSQINRFMQGREKTMSRKNTQALNSIQRICHIQKISMEDVYARAKLLLSIYRDVCWSTAYRAEEMEENLVCYCSGQRSDILMYLIMRQRAF